MSLWNLEVPLLEVAGIREKKEQRRKLFSLSKKIRRRRGEMNKEKSPFSSDRTVLCYEYINLAFANCSSIVKIFDAKILYLLAKITEEC